jgi:hypothetical protein
MAAQIGSVFLVGRDAGKCHGLIQLGPAKSVVHPTQSFAMTPTNDRFLETPLLD